MVGWCDLVCEQCFQMIELMVVVLMSQWRKFMYGMVLVLLVVGPVLGNG